MKKNYLTHGALLLTCNHPHKENVYILRSLSITNPLRVTFNDNDVELRENQLRLQTYNQISQNYILKCLMLLKKHGSGSNGRGMLHPP